MQTLVEAKRGGKKFTENYNFIIFRTNVLRIYGAPAVTLSHVIFMLGLDLMFRVVVFVILVSVYILQVCMSVCSQR